MSEEMQNDDVSVEEVQDQTGSPVSDVVEAAEREESFHSSLSDDLRDNPSLSDFKSVDDLAKSYVSAQQMIGNSIRIPTEQAGPETWDEFYSKLNEVPGIARIPGDTIQDSDELKNIFEKLGAPSSPDGYEVQVDDSLKDFVKDEVESFKEVAAKAHLTKAQAAALTEWRLGETKTQLEAMQQDIAQAQEVLKEKWGGSYQERLEGAGIAVRHFRESYGDSFQRIIDSPIGNHPAVLEMMSIIGSQLGESGAIQSSSTPTSYGMSPDEAATRIADLRANVAKMDAYNNPNHPDYKAVRNEMDRLYRIKMGG